jgi:hypothetical protein
MAFYIGRSAGVPWHLKSPVRKFAIKREGILSLGRNLRKRETPT